MDTAPLPLIEIAVAEAEAIDDVRTIFREYADGLGVVRLCEEHGVGVVKTQVPLMMPDLDLLDALRGA